MTALMADVVTGKLDFRVAAATLSEEEAEGGTKRWRKGKWMPLGWVSR